MDLALGIIGNPDVIFLDEPTTGLDPQGRREIWEVVRNFTALGKTVLLTTHYLDEAEQLAHRAGIIIKGELVEVGSPREIGGRQRSTARVTFVASGALAGKALPEGLDASVSGQLVTIETFEPTRVLAALTAWAAASGEPEIPELSVSRPSLEDIYLRMVAESEVTA